MLVNPTLNLIEYNRKALNLVKDDRSGMPTHESVQVALSIRPDIRVLEIDIFIVRKQLSRQGRLSRLTRTEYSYYGELLTYFPNIACYLTMYHIPAKSVVQLLICPALY